MHADDENQKIHFLNQFWIFSLELINTLYLKIKPRLMGIWFDKVSEIGENY